MAIPQLTPRTYRYIGSSLHIFSTIWLVALVAIVWMAAPAQRSEAQDVVRHGGRLLNAVTGLVAVILVVGFIVASIWIQATCWVERIKLGPDGIEWFGWNGKLKHQAKLGEIKSIDVEHSGKLDVMRIETMSGVIKATSHLRGFKDLAKQVNDVIEGFNEGLRPLPRKD